MAGSDQLARFRPEFKEARDYSGLQAQMMQNISDAQAERIRRQGDVMAKAAAIPGEAGQNLVDSYYKGKKTAAEEQQAAANLEKTKSETEAQNIANKSGQLKYGAEEKYQNFLDEPDMAHQGKTRRETANTSEYEQALQEPEFRRQKQQQEMAESEGRIKATNAQVNSTYHGMKTADQDREQDRFARLIDGIATTHPPGPDRDAAIADAVQKGQKHGGMDPALYQAVATSGARNFDAQKQGALTAAETVTTTRPGFQRLQDVSKKVADRSGAIQSLYNYANDYEKSFSLTGGRTPGASDQAQAAQASAAKLLRDTGDPGDSVLADNIMGMSAESVPTRIREIADKKAHEVVNDWHSQYLPTIPTSGPQDMSQRDEFRKTQDVVTGLQQGIGAHKAPKKNGRTLAPGAQGPGIVQGGNRSFTNPQKPSGAVAAPVQGMPPQGGMPPPGPVAAPTAPPQMPQYPYGPMNGASPLQGP